MNWTWIIIGAVIACVGGVITTGGWNWDKWHKKGDDASKKMEQSIKDSPGASAYQAGRDINK